MKQASNVPEYMCNSPEAVEPPKLKKQNKIENMDFSCTVDTGAQILHIMSLSSEMSPYSFGIEHGPQIRCF